MKRGVLAFLILMIFAHAPWKLMALAAETLVLHPGATRVSHENDQYWETMALYSRLTGMGWRVTVADELVSPDGMPAYGLTNTGTHEIEIDQTLSWNARYAVLAHEGGHTFQPSYATRAQGEVFAEAVATLVCHDGIREHARYLSLYKTDTLLVLLTESSAIYHAAAVLEDE